MTHYTDHVPAATEPDDWPAVDRPTADHVVYESDARLILACATDTTRIVRNWRVIDGHTVRRRDVEAMYNYPAERWESTQDHTHDYALDDAGTLVGDGSAWAGEGVAWKVHARRRHDALLAKRFRHLDREV